MAAGRSLTRKIDSASLEIAKRNAAKPERAIKYVHAGARMRYLHWTQGAAKLVKPNRAS